MAEQNVNAREMMEKQLVGLMAPAWWAVLLRGILLAVLGVYALSQPLETATAFIWALAIFWLADGVLAIVGWLTGALRSVPGLWLRAILNIICGLLIVTNPALGLLTEVLLVLAAGCFSLVGGVVEVFGAVKTFKSADHPWGHIFGGVVSIVFGLMLIAAPGISLAVLTLFAGSLAIFIGIAMVWAAIQLKRRA